MSTELHDAWPDEYPKTLEEDHHGEDHRHGEGCRGEAAGRYPRARCSKAVPPPPPPPPPLPS